MNNSEEIWKDVIGYEGFYQVSNFGNVKSLDRLVSGAGFCKTKIQPSRLLKLAKDLNGYFYVNLCVTGVRKLHRVHRLVMSSFMLNPQNKKDVNHVNGIKCDNHIDNLEWATRSENIIHAYKNLPRIKSPCKGDKNGGAKLTENQVKEIIILLPSKTSKELSDIYNVSISTIRHIRQNKLWKHLPR